MNALTVYVTYLWQAVFPLHLAVYYPHPGDNIAWGAVAAAAALLAAISLIVVARARRYPFLFVGWAWYLGTLVPMIGIVQVGRQQMADRYTYFPLIGLFLALVWLIPELVPAGALRAGPAGRRNRQPGCAGGDDFCPGWLLARQRDPVSSRGGVRGEQSVGHEHPRVRAHVTRPIRRGDRPFGSGGPHGAGGRPNAVQRGRRPAVRRPTG